MTQLLERYIRLVRVRISITLPADLLGQLDRADKNRSALIERAARAYLAHLASEERDRRDLEIINRNADRLNHEAMDSLKYQQLPWSAESSSAALIESRFTSVVCASIYSQHDGLSTQVSVGPDEGLKKDSSVHCDELVSLPKSIAVGLEGGTSPFPRRLAQVTILFTKVCFLLASSRRPLVG